MKNLNIIFAIISSSILVSCASVHPGLIGKSVGPADSIGIKPSAQVIDFNKRDNFQMVEVTLENTSDEWIRIDKIRARLPDPSVTKISVVMGQDLVDWAEAKRAQQSLNEYNNKVIQAALVGVGAAASMSGNSTVSAAGGVAVLGGTGWAIKDGVSKDIRSAEEIIRVPSTHLYAPVAIPGKMFQRRWILFNKPPTAFISSLIIDVTTVDGKKGTYEIPLDIY
jgi:hypothetical protein